MIRRLLQAVYSRDGCKIVATGTLVAKYPSWSSSRAPVGAYACGELRVVRPLGGGDVIHWWAQSIEGAATGIRANNVEVLVLAPSLSKLITYVMCIETLLFLWFLRKFNKKVVDLVS